MANIAKMADGEVKDLDPLAEICAENLQSLKQYIAVPADPVEAYMEQARRQKNAEAISKVVPTAYDKVHTEEGVLRNRINTVLEDIKDKMFPELERLRKIRIGYQNMAEQLNIDEKKVPRYVASSEPAETRIIVYRGNDVVYDISYDKPLNKPQS